jgi:hypothetical protein
MTTALARKQAAFYANFIRLTVEMYKSNPKSLEPDSPVDFPSENFEIIAYIKATQRFLNKETLKYLK